MTWHIRLETAQLSAFAIVLVASSCIALAGIGQARDAKSCSVAQVQSRPGSECVKLLEKDVQAGKKETHILVCDTTSVQCCLQKPNGPYTQCTASTTVTTVGSTIAAAAAVVNGISKVQVNNAGSIPLKVVILTADGRFVDIGRTPDYKTGGFSIELTKDNKPITVSKYHWEVFAPGAVEPCQKLRDETKSSITVQCQR